MGCASSHHPNERQEAEPTRATIPSAIGKPEELDTGAMGPATQAVYAMCDIDADIVTGRDPLIPARQQRFASLPDPLPEDASAYVTMASRLKTAPGNAISGARTGMGARHHQEV